MHRLVLFDIDLTLLYSGGAGLEALRHAFREVFKLPSEEPIELDLAGATDSGLLLDFLALRGLEPCPAKELDFYECYLRHLERELPRAKGGCLLPGVRELLEKIAGEGFLIPGVLTGNIRQGALMKLRHFGLDGLLDTDSAAYGDDHPDRNRLGPVAIGRASLRHQVRIHPHNVVVVGDTARDIECGRAAGVRTLGLGTGMDGGLSVGKAEPDVMIRDLSDTAGVYDLLLDLTGGSPSS